eukprot:6708400-Prymnesium_polylepis.1
MAEPDRLLTLELENARLREEVRKLREVQLMQSEALKESTKLLLKMKPVPRPPLSADRKAIIAGEQLFRCAGDRSQCPQWLLYGGSFDAACFEIDHVLGWASSCRGVGALQALCPTCHARKTRLERAMAMEREGVEED